jgi:hypothetical protein
MERPRGGHQSFSDAMATQLRTKAMSWTGRWGIVIVVELGSGCGGSVETPSLPGSSATGASNDGGPGASAEPGARGAVTRDDGAAASNPEVAYAVTLTMSGFTVPAAGEVYKCQDFANPFQGQQVDIKTYELAMNAGSHHMILFYSQGAADGSVIDCPEGGLKTGPFTFGSQSQKATQTYPEGVGATIPPGMGFTMNAHYVNPGSSPIQAAVAVTMFVAVPGVVTQHAGALQYILTSISIPAGGQPVTVTGSCAAPQDLNLLWAGSHMHKRATHFISRSGTTTLYQTDQWADPAPTEFSPPLPIKAGADITWSCTYVNDTGSTLTFGQSALTNAMCNANGGFYPVLDISNPLISCLQ